jgi:hypothetical protein
MRILTVRAAFPHTAPPRVCDGEAIALPGMKDVMKDDRFWEPVVRQLRHSCPREPIRWKPTMKPSA